MKNLSLRFNPSTRLFLAVGIAVALAAMFAVFAPRQAQEPLNLQELLNATAEAAHGGGTEMFLKIEGIEGEARDAAHRNEIQIESFSWGESQTGAHASGGGSGSGKVTMQDFHFTMSVNKASPKLFQAVASGTHYKSAVLTVRKAGRQDLEYLKWTFSDVIVSSYQTGGSHSDIIPMDQISFNFSKIDVEYKEQKDDGSLGGSVKAGWDVKRNKEF